MGPKKARKLIDDEAECYESDSDEPSSDGSDDSLDGFIVPDGELSDGNFVDDNDDKPVTVPPSVKTPKKRGRPPGKTVATKANAESLHAPGDSRYPVNEFSLTITKKNGDVHIEAVDVIGKFITDHCLKGAISTEVGPRVHNYHLQGIIRVRWPKAKKDCTELQKILKRLLPERGNGYRIVAKPLGTNQTFVAMLGYVTKDSGKYLFLCLFCPKTFLIICNFTRTSPLSTPHSHGCSG